MKNLLDLRMSGDILLNDKLEKIEKLQTSVILAESNAIYDRNLENTKYEMDEEINKIKDIQSFVNL